MWLVYLPYLCSQPHITVPDRRTVIEQWQDYSTVQQLTSLSLGRTSRARHRILNLDEILYYRYIARGPSKIECCLGGLQDI